ncbi:DUF6397 family protein [Streptomyces melanogenes]|uniref:DUF6397 family protein n=1 Tax=Streptomyces melanogenes TaxID=67326 RepID=UPI00167D630A|nr:DUF6397 family protein [Streptomyces melanogenes]GGP32245.1 hypothetical protein GCM10010278_02820 [Streptomyces melanogenes]
MTTTTTAEVSGKTVTLGRAAQQLDLKRGEFDLAVQLGHVRTVREDLGARPRVAQEEVERIRSAEDFPEALRERVRVVGTAEASQLLDVPAHRFTRLARGGHFTPVKCYLNRYRAVVWLYLAEELTDLALRHPELLTDRQLPKETLVRLGAGEDRRPRNWRGRRAAMLLQQTDDPWERAAGIASALDAAHLAELVTDPYELAYLSRLRPETARVGPDSPAAREIIERLQLAQDPDEVLWHRMDLAQHLSIARSARPAPRPEWERPAIGTTATATAIARPAHVPAPASSPGPTELKPSQLRQSYPKGRELEPVGVERVESRGGHGRLRRGLARLRRPRTAARSSTTAP